MANENTFVLNFIDSPMWDKAEWKGVLYACDMTFRRPPTLGIIYRNEAAAKSIFAGLRDTVGADDKHNLLRVSIVEGDIPGQDPGYTVHISADLDNTKKRAEADGQPFDPKRIHVFGRIYRMHPSSNSQNLPNFKRAFERVGRYSLVPFSMNSPVESSSSLVAHPELAIIKTQIYFRQFDELEEHDIDRVVRLS